VTQISFCLYYLLNAKKERCLCWFVSLNRTHPLKTTPNNLRKSRMTQDTFCLLWNRDRRGVMFSLGKDTYGEFDWRGVGRISVGVSTSTYKVVPQSRVRFNEILTLFHCLPFVRCHEDTLVFFSAAENCERQIEQQNARVGTHSKDVVVVVCSYQRVERLQFFTGGLFTRNSRDCPSSPDANATWNCQKDRHDVYRGIRRRLIHVLRPLFIALCATTVIISGRH